MCHQWIKKSLNSYPCIIKTQVTNFQLTMSLCMHSTKVEKGIEVNIRTKPVVQTSCLLSPCLACDTWKPLGNNPLLEQWCLLSGLIHSGRLGPEIFHDGLSRVKAFQNLGDHHCNLWFIFKSACNRFMGPPCRFYEPAQQCCNSGVYGTRLVLHDPFYALLMLLYEWMGIIISQSKGWGMQPGLEEKEIYSVLFH